MSQARNKENYKHPLLENVFSRGKYTLSEREFPWNERNKCPEDIEKQLRRSLPKKETSDFNSDTLRNSHRNSYSEFSWFLKFRNMTFYFGVSVRDESGVHEKKFTGVIWKVSSLILICS